MRRVLVTRPEPGAAETAARVAAAGFASVVLPLTRTEPLPVTTLPDPKSFDAVALTSASAVRHAPAPLLAALAGKPCYAVGERTAEAASQAGLSIAAAAEGNAAALAQRIIAEVPAKARILLLCGRVRTDGLGTALHRAGMTTHIIETYDTRAIEYDDEAAAILADAPLWAALAYSVNGAAALAALAARRRFAEKNFAETLFLCMSPRIAAALDTCPSERIRVAAEPSEEAMLALLKSEA